jgi:hypothetical protein
LQGNFWTPPNADQDQRTRHHPADRAQQEIGTEDLQEIVSKVAARERVAINARAPKFGAYRPTSRRAR